MFEKIEKIYQKINSHLWLSIIIHLVIIAAILFLWLPIGKMFNDSHPPLGNDYYQFTSYVDSIDQSFRLPPASWRSEWFMGQAHIYDHPWLHVYLALPAAKIFGLIKGTNLYSLFCLFLFFVCTYLATNQISRNKLLSGFLAASLVWVNSLYIPLFSGGNTNFSSSLFFLPLIIYFIIKYYHSDKRRYFFLACLFQGISFLAHPGTALFFIFLPTAAVLFFYSDKKVKFFSWRKFKDLFIFIISSALIGGPLLFALIKLYLELVSFGKETGEGKEVADTFTTMFQMINMWIFLPLGIAFFSALFSKKFWRKFQKFIPVIIIFVYIFTLEWLYYVGKNPLRGNILPTRTYWLISFAAVLGIAIFWSNIIKLNSKNDCLGSKIKVFILIFQILILGSLGYLIYPKGNTEEMLEPTISFISTMRPYADAYPKEFAHKAIVYGEDDNFNEYFPTWLDKETNQYRIHSLIPGFNIWWNILYEPTLTHGYYDSRSRIEQDWNYWMDTALAGELTYNYGQPGEVSKNSALFLIDWFAIKYLEGILVDYQTGLIPQFDYDTLHKGSITLLSSYLIEDEDIVEHENITTDIEVLKKKLGGNIPTSITDFLDHVEWLASYGLATQEDLSTGNNVKPMTDEEVKNQLRKEGWADFWVNMDFLNPQGYYLPTTFMSVNDKYVSPLVTFTDSPTCLVVGQKEGHNNLIRTLGHLNYNSQYLVPVRGPESLNQVSEKELEDFDCVFLYLYKKTSSSSWDKLNKFVQAGGTVYIDTGGEVAESEKTNLPEIFPIESTDRGSLGTEWEVTYDKSVFNQINFSSFEPLEYEGRAWNLSYAGWEKEGANVLLSQDQKPIIVEQDLGEGKVIWSGINLPFRVNYLHNPEEVKLFDVVLNQLVDMEINERIDTVLTREIPESLSATGKKAKGMIFKENYDDGWKAKYSAASSSGGLKIYPAGPDMMYVSLPENIEGEVKVDFNFRGSLMAWFLYLTSLLTILFFIILPIFDKKFFNFSKKSIKSIPVTKKIKSWWEKDEEE